jgi:KDO2-lipid IV(A) lauroyltransferase
LPKFRGPDFQKIEVNMKRYIDQGIERILRMGIAFIGVVPLRLLHLVGERLALLVFFIWRKRRGIIIANLKLAFGPHLDKREMKRLYRGIVSNVGKGFVETLKLPSLPDRFFDSIDVTGLDHLKNALGQGEGVIAVSAHLGNFALIGRKLSLLGYRFNYISRDPHNRWGAKIFEWIRECEGVNFIPDKPKHLCLKRSIECLKNGEILFIQNDISAVSGGIYIDFFGHEVPTFKGPVTLSLRSGAPILPMFIVWDGEDRQRIIIEAPLPLIREGRIEDDIYKNTSHIVKIIEGYIRRYPTQWWWVHRRWKRRREKISNQIDQNIS